MTTTSVLGIDIAKNTFDHIPGTGLETITSLLLLIGLMVNRSHWLL